jgi:Tol biopolymer transport system component
LTDLSEQLQATLGDACILERELGGGGMSRVFLATEAALGRQIVVKVLPADTGNAVSVERFKREIAVVARLQHPHIVPILTAGESQGLPFYTMPFVKGDSLRARLAKGGELSVNETLHVLRDIASALAYAHGEGIVHRDIKPENVILSGGVAVVTDFGVAKAVDVAISDGGHAKSGLTSLGVALGTPAYMAPEQATADPHVDHRADIYAFGCVAYEMLAGSSPFSGRPLQQLLAAHVTVIPDAVAVRRPNVPPALSVLVMRCLEKRPGDRPQSADELITAIDAIATPSGGSAPTEARLAAVQPARRRTAIVLGIGAIAVAVISLVVAAIFRGGPAPLVMGAVTQVTRSTDTLNFDASISPDGKLVAYAAGVAGRMRIFVRQVSGSSPVPLATQLGGGHRWPRWSPDGSKLAFDAKGAIYVIPVLGGPPQLLVDSSSQPSWSPDGTQIAFVRSSGIWVVAVSGGSPRRIVQGRSAHSPAWSPDGRRIGYVEENSSFVTSVNYGNASPSTVWTASTSGGDSAVVTDAAHLNVSPVWWPDGRSILYVSDRDGTRDVYRQPLSANGRPTGKPDRVTSGLDVFTITLSRDGSVMAYSTLRLRANIWMAPISATGTTPTSAAHPVTNERQAVEGIAISHDSKWLAYDSDRNGNLDVFKVAFNGTVAVGDPVALTTDPAADFEPRWSPNDGELVFYSRRFGTRDVFTVRADGRDEHRITDLPTQEYYPDWSPDGQRIVFNSPDTRFPDARGRNVFVMTRNADGGWSAARRINDTTQTRIEQAVRWAPDGRSIALVRDSALSLLPLEGGALKLLVDGRRIREAITFLAWTRNPATVYFQSRDSTGIYSFWSVPMSGGSPRRLLKLAEPGRRTRRIEFDTDGKNLFFSIAADEADVAVVNLKRP